MKSGVQSISQDSLSFTSFASWEGIGANNLKVKMKGENTKDKELFLFEVKMDTDVGTSKRKSSLSFVFSPFILTFKLLAPIPS
jgi:hypothetical protein